MSNSSQYYAFATGAGANVLTNSQLAALSILTTGFQSGIVPSIQYNSILRQAQFVATMITKFTADYGPGNVNDDGNLATLEAQFVAALGTLFPSASTVGQLLRTTVYTNVSAVQYISINGGAPTTTGASTFTSLGSTNVVFAEAQAAGGSGGACPSTNSSQDASSGGGAGGNYGLSEYTSGFSGGLSITVGAGGAAPSPGSNNGIAGGLSSVDSLLSVQGGAGGGCGVKSASQYYYVDAFGGAPGTTGGISGANLLAVPGRGGGPGVLANGAGCLTDSQSGGEGGSSFLGLGGVAFGSNFTSASGPNPGTGFGSGSSGVAAGHSNPVTTTVAGQPGRVKIVEMT